MLTNTLGHTQMRAHTHQCLHGVLCFAATCWLADLLTFWWVQQRLAVAFCLFAVLLAFASFQLRRPRRAQTLLISLRCCRSHACHIGLLLHYMLRFLSLCCLLDRWFGCAVGRSYRTQQNTHTTAAALFHLLFPLLQPQQLCAVSRLRLCVYVYVCALWHMACEWPASVFNPTLTEVGYQII